MQTRKPDFWRLANHFTMEERNLVVLFAPEHRENHTLDTCNIFFAEFFISRGREYFVHAFNFANLCGAFCQMEGGIHLRKLLLLILGFWASENATDILDVA